MDDYNYDLRKFISWQAAAPNRQVDIKIGREPGMVSIWAYDYSLQCGQHVTSAEEIDILALQRERDMEAMEAIRKRHPDIIIPVAPGIDINLGGGIDG